MFNVEREHVVRTVRAYVPNGKTMDDDLEIAIRYTDTKLLGNGSFGVVYQAKLVDTNELVAIKKVLQDRRFKICGIANRELQIMRRLEHPNIVRLKYYFYWKGERPNEEFLNMVLEYVPDTAYRVSKSYSKTGRPFPMLLVKLYMYQLLRALAYLHSLDICHRDVKPQNMLIHSEAGILKLCDFGSAKFLIHGEANVSYICSRYYRAPELIFGSNNYSTAVDIWSVGCVFGELLLGKPMFTGESAVDQLVEIIKVLGTPTQEQIGLMNPNFAKYKFPNIKVPPLSTYFGDCASAEGVSLVQSLLQYEPAKRITAIKACAHSFFDELRTVGCRLPTGKDLPPLFNFTISELNIDPQLNSKLIPAHLAVQSSGSTSPCSSDSEFDRTVSEDDGNGFKM